MMSSEMNVGFAWKSPYKPWKVELLICKAAGIYKDPFNSDDNYSVYDLNETDHSTNTLNTFTCIKIVSLKPGIYHFVYRVYRTEDGDEDMCTSEFYCKTKLSSGREVNYIEVISTNSPRNHSTSLYAKT
ncbi:hypothetical protein AC249_AIPGENE6135 [Exaiptasia diaphana]|nr:hypothetical protein AC249_AIPGENE6135 [Exaiptasia diaphana]